MIRCRTTATFSGSWICNTKIWLRCQQHRRHPFARTFGSLQDQTAYKIELIPFTNTRRPPGKYATLKQRKNPPTITPVGNLIRSLQSIRGHNLVPRCNPWKHDISYINAYNTDKQRTRQESYRYRINKIIERGDQHALKILIRGRGTPEKRRQSYFARSILRRRVDNPLLNLQTLLARFIRCNFSRSSSGNYERLPTDHKDANTWKTSDAEALLTSKGYDPDDLQSWSSILLAENVVDACKRLLSYSALNLQELNKPLPSFIPLFLLCRNDIHKEALDYIIAYLWDVVDSKCAKATDGAYQDTNLKSSSSELMRQSPMDDSSLYIAFVRLMRHARRVNSIALTSITAMFIKAFIEVTSSKASSQFTRQAKLVKLCNRTLRLLSIPSSIEPFQSCFLHQRAQFDILEAMARATPPISVSREGYRAVIQMQLASPKTTREIDWAQLKARSWPPWKEDKTGMDAEKDVAYGTSRALQAMRHACEAGYGIKLWEKTARILAGWDLDGSPTIQTRSFVLHERHTGVRDENSIMVWTARIRATRTVQEAWACFLAYDDLKLQSHSDLYLAMFEKLFWEKIRHSHEGPNSSSHKDNMNDLLLQPLTAGDGKEVMAASPFPRESIYVHIPPPELEELADQMFSRGVRPRSRCLAFLISHAKTFELGMSYIRKASQGMHDVNACLLSNSPASDERFNRVSIHVFSAYISLLCRFPCGTDGPIQSGKQFYTKLIYRRNYLFAYHLLTARNLNYPPAWFALLRALVKDMKPIHRQPPPPLHHCLMMYQLVQKALRKMEKINIHDRSECFMNICKALWYLKLSAMHDAKSKFSMSWRVESFDDSALDRDILRSMVKELLDVGPASVERAFLLLTGEKKCPDSTVSYSKDRIGALKTPHPTHLHIYFRALGVLGDWDGFLRGIEWMVTKQHDIQDVVLHTRNGRHQLRQTIISIRSFLECNWTVANTSRDSINSKTDIYLFSFQKAKGSVPDQVLLRAKNLVESVEIWGGWPTDDEIYKYCEKVSKI